MTLKEQQKKNIHASKKNLFCIICQQVYNKLEVNFLKRPNYQDIDVFDCVLPLMERMIALLYWSVCVRERGGRFIMVPTNLRVGSDFPILQERNQSLSVKHLPWGCVQVTCHTCAFPHRGSLTPKQQQKLGAFLETGMLAQKPGRDYQAVRRKDQITCPGKSLPIRL